MINHPNQASTIGKMRQSGDEPPTALPSRQHTPAKGMVVQVPKKDDEEFCGTHVDKVDKTPVNCDPDITEKGRLSEPAHDTMKACDLRAHGHATIVSLDGS